ncbi:N-methyl-L-tryptophan oxidase [Streptomyces sp. ODS28]|uniref:N-methyl-L-tryptophan oxidase n=1 Tax=Streptomyces sp. ODS28 TaxID=3136688 RepID=UPI0031E745D8
MLRPPARVAVIGAGTMGSMVLWHLARRGVGAVGFDPYAPGHDHGAAGGASRIFRLAYREGAQYVPLLRAAREKWLELQNAWHEPLFDPCGALTVGPEAHPDVARVLDVARAGRVPVDVLDRKESERRYPQHQLDDEDVTVVDPHGGLLRPDRAIRAAAAAARAHGAELRTGTSVTGLEADDGGVRVTAGGRGERFDTAVVCAGPWTTDLLPEVARAVELRRAVLGWFEPEEAAAEGFAPERFPVGIRRGSAAYSFFPAHDGHGVKMNLYAPKAVVSHPRELSGAVEPDYRERMGAAAASGLRGLRPGPARTAAYLDGYTPDNHGLLGPVSGLPGVLAMAGFSGHGFKLSPVFGEIAADLLTEGRTAHGIEHLRVHRFG